MAGPSDDQDRDAERRIERERERRSGAPQT